MDSGLRRNDSVGVLREAHDSKRKGAGRTGSLLAKEQREWFVSSL